MTENSNAEKGQERPNKKDAAKHKESVDSAVAALSDADKVDAFILCVLNPEGVGLSTSATFDDMVVLLGALLYHFKKGSSSIVQYLTGVIGASEVAKKLEQLEGVAIPGTDKPMTDEEKAKLKETLDTLLNTPAQGHA